MGAQWCGQVDRLYFCCKHPFGHFKRLDYFLLDCYTPFQDPREGAAYGWRQGTLLYVSSWQGRMWAFGGLVPCSKVRWSALKVFCHLPHYQNTFQVLFAHDLELTTLRFSAQSHTDWDHFSWIYSDLYPPKLNQCILESKLSLIKIR